MKKLSESHKELSKRVHKMYSDMIIKQKIIEEIFWDLQLKGNMLQLHLPGSFFESILYKKSPHCLKIYSELIPYVDVKFTDDIRMYRTPTNTIIIDGPIQQMISFMKDNNITFSMVDIEQKTALLWEQCKYNQDVLTSLEELNKKEG